VPQKGYNYYFLIIIMPKTTKKIEKNEVVLENKKVDI
jgi:hypothetical protein